MDELLVVRKIRSRGVGVLLIYLIDHCPLDIWISTFMPVNAVAVLTCRIPIMPHPRCTYLDT